MFNLQLGKGAASAPAAAAADAEQDEIAELQQLFSSRGAQPVRESTIPKTTLARLKVGEELLLHADEARQEKEDRRRVREAQMSERLARAQTRREEAKQRQERCRAAREKEHQRKLDLARSVKADEDHWEQQRQRMTQQLHDEARSRVELAAGPYKNLDARLDAQEAEADQLEREDGTRMRNELKSAIESTRMLMLSEKKAGAESQRDRRTRALERAAKQQALLKRLAADEKRAEAKAWLMERRHNESQHLQKAQQFRSNVAESRERTRRVQAQTLNNRKMAAMKERANDVLVDQEKARILASNKELVAYTYRSKFASSKEAEEWGCSSLLQFRSDYFGRTDPTASMVSSTAGGGVLQVQGGATSPLPQKGTPP